MQRWFYADEQTSCEKRSSSSSLKSLTESASSVCVPSIHYKFCVVFKDELCTNEKLAVIGNIEMLGKWNIASCLILEQDENSEWSMSVTLPHEFDIYYRYIVIAIDGRGHKILRYWESHIYPRDILLNQNIPEPENCCTCFFGYKDDIYQVQRGWLDYSNIAVQLKVFNAPFVLKIKRKEFLFNIKITPVRLKQQQEVCDKILNAGQIQNDLLFQIENGKISEDLYRDFAFCEVASLKNGLDHFHYQPKYGTPCGPEDMLLFNLLLGDFQNTAYLVNFYTQPHKAVSDIPPYHFGYLYIMPEQLKGSHGSLKVDIICASKHRQIGYFKLDYLVVHAFPNTEFPVQQTISDNLKSHIKPWHIAHRGCGKSFLLDKNIIRENTLNSFNLAVEHADIIEFDVQLTKDNIPIIYHDLTLNLSSNKNIKDDTNDVHYLPLTKNEMTEILKHGQQDEHGFTKVPVRHFTRTNLKKIEGFEERSTLNFESSACLINPASNKPFVTLKKALQYMPEHISFDIEIKWPIKLNNNNWEYCSEGGVNMNDFVDAIIQVVIQHGAKRSIIFSSFSADICSMLQLKQRIYPVLYLAKGVRFLDPRGKNVLNAALFAHAIELMGIGIKSTNILPDYSDVLFVQEKGLQIIAWSEENRDEDKRLRLTSLGLDGIIYDRINHIMEPVDLNGIITIVEIQPESNN